MLPPDDHVHSEWSWDAPDGAMEATCARAVELGLPSVAFTEHVDHTRWWIAPEVRAQLTKHASLVADDDRLDPPPFDLDGYLACLERCRDRFPGLRILSGLELGEPHWYADRCRDLIARMGCDRPLGSLHTVTVDGKQWLADDAFREGASDGFDYDQVMRDYLAEALVMVESFDEFAVLAHIDYPVRGWAASGLPFDPARFEEEYRAVLRGLAASGRALEVNTRLPLAPEIVGWWREEGGEAVSFGSDAHRPSALADGFADAAAMVEAHGFAPGRHPHDFWRRRSSHPVG